jgi:hypothetical protein
MSIIKSLPHGSFFPQAQSTRSARFAPTSLAHFFRAIVGTEHPSPFDIPGPDLPSFIPVHLDRHVDRYACEGVCAKVDVGECLLQTLFLQSAVVLELLYGASLTTFEDSRRNNLPSSLSWLYFSFSCDLGIGSPGHFSLPVAGSRRGRERAM